MSALLEQLNKVYFWDIDPDNLDEIASKNLIIERVMNYGNLREIQLVGPFDELMKPLNLTLTVRPEFNLDSVTPQEVFIA